jgi:hypothetical protein
VLLRQQELKTRGVDHTHMRRQFAAVCNALRGGRQRPDRRVLAVTALARHWPYPHSLKD